MLKTFSKQSIKFLDLPFFSKYVVKFFVFYHLCNLGHWLWTGVTDPRGWVYFSFLANYLDYITFIKFYVFQSSIFLADIFGVHAYQTSPITLTVDGGGSLFMERPCYGLELMSFWTAFVLADSTPVKKKLFWVAAGIVSLLVINGLRVTLMLIGLKKKWALLNVDLHTFDHHTVFNICAYSMIFMLMYVYYKRNKLVSQV